MASVKVVIDVPALEAFKSWNGPLGHSVGRLAKETVFRQKVLANKRSGAMAGSLTYKKGKTSKGIMFEAGSWSIPYTLFMEEGTKPHTITPKNAPRLVFFWPKAGKVMHLKSVNHPGTKPYGFLKEGLERAMNMWERGG